MQNAVNSNVIGIEQLKEICVEKNMWTLTRESLQDFESVQFDCVRTISFLIVVLPEMEIA